MKTDQQNRIRLKISSFSSQSIDKTCADIIRLLINNKIQFSGPVLLPNNEFKFTLFKPHFIHKKKSKETFGYIIHKRLLDIKLSGNVSMNVFKNFNIKPEVEIKIHRLVK